LTEAGDQLFQRVRPAVQELAAAIGQTSELRACPAGIVRIHCFRVAAELFLRPLLRPFHDEYPDVVLDITLDDEVVDIVAGGYDAAIRIGEVIERDMVAIKLGPDLRQFVVASPDSRSATDGRATAGIHRCGSRESEGIRPVISADVTSLRVGDRIWPSRLSADLWGRSVWPLCRADCNGDPPRLRFRTGVSSPVTLCRRGCRATTPTRPRHEARTRRHARHPACRAGRTRHRGGPTPGVRGMSRAVSKETKTMNRKVTKKKLSLAKSTLRTLSVESMKAAVGGQTLATCSAICSDVICPPTGVNHGCGPVD
jgi:hypothetical protein